ATAGPAFGSLQDCRMAELQEGLQKVKLVRSLLPSCHPAILQFHGTLVSSTRQTRSSNSMPTAFAALGTSEWLVMPGDVLTSSRKLRPDRSRITSTRPQPEQPAARNASSASDRSCSSACPSRPGQMYCVVSAMYFAW